MGLQKFFSSRRRSEERISGKLESVSEGQPEEFPSRRSYSIEAEDLLVETVWCLVIKRPMHIGGFYLDIGAAHPISHSNTNYFYERGWSGICVEPNPEFHALYKVHRPRDRTLNIGISTRSGVLRYHRFDQPLINGFYSQEMLERHVASGETYLGSSDVQCVGIREFLKAHVDRPVDFMNIDIETLDAEILAAWDWEVCRPKIICAEIHTTDIRAMLDGDIVNILEKAGYTAMCRGWLSAIFVDKQAIEGRPSNAGHP